MTFVAGVDFGTQSVRVSIVDHLDRCRRVRHRRVSDRARARRSRLRHAVARGAHGCAGRGDARWRWRTRVSRAAQIKALALDTTGSTVVPVGAGLEPLDDYYLWCDHRAAAEAARITEVAHEIGLAGDPRLRRRLFVGMGFRQAAALAAAPSRAARRRSSRRSNIATWSRRCSAASPIPTSCRAASAPWATSGSGVRTMAACRRKTSWSRSIRFFAGVRAQARRALPDVRHAIAGTAHAGMGRATGTRRRDSDSGRRVRRALGCDRRRHRRRRRGQRGRHRDLRHGDREGDVGDPRPLRHRARIDPSGLHRHRSGPLRHRLPVRVDRAPREHHRRGAQPGAGQLTAPAKPACCASAGTTAIAPCSSIRCSAA